MRSLDSFIGAVKRTGIAQKHLFTVSMLLPKGLSKKYSNKDVEEICLLCQSAPLKGTTIMTQPRRTFGIASELPYEKPASTFDLTFLILSDFKTKEFFDNWMKLIFSSSTGTWGIREDYLSEITVINEDKSGKNRYGMTHYECYPKESASIDLVMDDATSHLAYQITFVCTYSKQKDI